jgi:hypothetical protein
MAWQRRTTASAARALATAAFAISAGASGCGEPPLCYGVKVGDRIAITVVDTYAVPGDHTSYDAGRSDICGFGFDISKGQVLVITVVQNVLDGTGACRGAIARFEPFGAWTWTLGSVEGTNAADILNGEYITSDGMCTGQVDVSLVVQPGSDPFATSLPGRPPNVYLYRSFSGAAAMCHKDCSGSFVVNLKRLQ